MSGQLSTRARLLLAFDEGSTLTRQQAMQRANTNDGNEFRHLVDGDYLRPTEWVPNRPREFRLAPRGVDRRAQYEALVS